MVTCPAAGPIVSGLGSRGNCPTQSVPASIVEAHLTETDIALLALLWSYLASDR